MTIARGLLLGTPRRMMGEPSEQYLRRKRRRRRELEAPREPLRIRLGQPTITPSEPEPSPEERLTQDLARRRAFTEQAWELGAPAREYAEAQTTKRARAKTQAGLTRQGELADWLASGEGRHLDPEVAESVFLGTRTPTGALAARAEQARGVEAETDKIGKVKEYQREWWRKFQEKRIAKADVIKGLQARGVSDELLGDYESGVLTTPKAVLTEHRRQQAQLAQAARPKEFKPSAADEAKLRGFERNVANLAAKGDDTTEAENKLEILSAQVRGKEIRFRKAQEKPVAAPPKESLGVPAPREAGGAEGESTEKTIEAILASGKPAFDVNISPGDRKFGQYVREQAVRDDDRMYSLVGKAKDRLMEDRGWSIETVNRYEQERGSKEVVAKAGFLEEYNRITGRQRARQREAGRRTAKMRHREAADIRRDLARRRGEPEVLSEEWLQKTAKRQKQIAQEIREGGVLGSLGQVGRAAKRLGKRGLEKTAWITRYTPKRLREEEDLERRIPESLRQTYRFFRGTSER